MFFIVNKNWKPDSVGLELTEVNKWPYWMNFRNKYVNNNGRKVYRTQSIIKMEPILKKN